MLDVVDFYVVVVWLFVCVVLVYWVVDVLFVVF